MTTYTSNPDVVARHIRGESILVPIAGTMEALDSIISLNETAEFIRTNAVAGLNENAIVQSVMDTYEIESDEAARDVALVLVELMAIGALKKADLP